MTSPDLNTICDSEIMYTWWRACLECNGAISHQQAQCSLENYIFSSKFLKLSVISKNISWIRGNIHPWPTWSWNIVVISAICVPGQLAIHPSVHLSVCLPAPSTTLWLGRPQCSLHPWPKVMAVAQINKNLLVCTTKWETHVITTKLGSYILPP